MIEAVCSNIAPFSAENTAARANIFVDIAANICRNCQGRKYLWTIVIATFHFGNRNPNQTNKSVQYSREKKEVTEKFCDHLVSNEGEHRQLIVRQNWSLMIIAAHNRALMTTCAVNCRSQVRKMSVYRVLSGDYGCGIGGMKVL